MIKCELIEFPNELLENKEIPKYVPKWLNYYIQHWNIAPTENGCVAKNKGKIIGLTRFKIKNNKIRSKVTLVKKDFRNQKVAQKMWGKIIKEFEPKEVLIFAATPAGYRFSNKLSEKYKKIKWNIQKIY